MAGKISMSRSAPPAQPPRANCSASRRSGANMLHEATMLLTTVCSTVHVGLPALRMARTCSRTPCSSSSRVRAPRMTNFPLALMSAVVLGLLVRAIRALKRLGLYSVLLMRSLSDCNERWQLSLTVATMLLTLGCIVSGIHVPRCIVDAASCDNKDGAGRSGCWCSHVAPALVSWHCSSMQLPLLTPASNMRRVLGDASRVLQRYAQRHIVLENFSATDQLLR